MRTPPAEEIARASPCTPVRVRRTALIRFASFSAPAGSSPGISRNSPTAAGDSPATFRSQLVALSLPRGFASRPASASTPRSGRRSTVSAAVPSRPIASLSPADRA
jgi:hypothetical protein